jgi:hypothetical protein
MLKGKMSLHCASRKVGRVMGPTLALVALFLSQVLQVLVLMTKFILFYKLIELRKVAGIEK